MGRGWRVTIRLGRVCLSQAQRSGEGAPLGVVHLLLLGDRGVSLVLVHRGHVRHEAVGVGDRAERTLWLRDPRLLVPVVALSPGAQPRLARSGIARTSTNFTCVPFSAAPSSSTASKLTSQIL